MIGERLLHLSEELSEVRSTVVAKLEAEEEVLYMALDDPKYFDGLEWHASDGVVRGENPNP